MAVYLVIVINTYGGLEKSGQFGDLFGGLNALFSGLAFAGVIIAILLQSKELTLQREELTATREELKAQKEQMEAQNKTLRFQRFENTFFHLINLHNEMVENISIPGYKGRSSFQGFYNKFQKEYNQISQQEGGQLILIDKAFSNFWNAYQPYLSHYLNHIIYILKFIKNKKEINPKEYSPILRVQLSTYEIVLLFYYCLTLKGRDKLKPLAIKFKLFDELPVENLINPSHASLLQS